MIFRIYIADFETVSNGSQRNAYPFHGVAADILNDMGNLFRVVNGKAKAGAPVDTLIWSTLDRSACFPKVFGVKKTTAAAASRLRSTIIRMRTLFCMVIPPSLWGAHWLDD